MPKKYASKLMNADKENKAAIAINKWIDTLSVSILGFFEP